MAHITFVHGSGNKPPREILLDLWERALRMGDGVDLGSRGATTSMVYWADALHALPLDDPVEYERASADTGLEPVERVSMAWERGLELADKRWVAGLAAQLGVAIGAEEGAAAPQSAVESRLDPIALPWPVKRWLMKTVLRDAHHYLFNASYSPRPGRIYRVRDEIRQRMQAVLTEGAGRPHPHIVISHGMGALVAYDCLKRASGPPLDALMTIGSPLGIDEIQERLRPAWTREDGFPGERLRGPWINVYDPLDLATGREPALAPDYREKGKEVVEDVVESSSGPWRQNASKYLGGARLRARLTALLDA